MVSFIPPQAPLGHDAPLSESATYPLLGVPVRIESNSGSVIAAAHASFGGWQQLGSGEVSDVAPRLLRVVVHEAAASVSPTPLIQRAHSGTFLASGDGCLMMANYAAGHALAYVTPAFAADEAALRHHVLECLALLMVSPCDRLPIHAAAITRGSHAILLLGSSGRGKSTLSYAALRHGFHLLSEDVVYGSTAGAVRFWGNPWRIHLLPDAPRLFAELSHVPTQLLTNGKRKLVVNVTERFPQQISLWANSVTPCLVQHHARMDSQLIPLAPDAIRQHLTQRPESGYDLNPLSESLIAAISANGGYSLTVGRDVEGALELLHQLM